MNNDISAPARHPMFAGGRRPLTAAKAVAPPIKRRSYSAPQPEATRRSVLQIIQLPLLLIAGALAGFFAEALAVGLAMLAVYGVFAFVTRIPSRTTFTLALLLLAAICLMLLAKPSGILIQNFSTYTFILLLIGVITLGREAKLPKRTRRKYKR